MKAAIPVYQGQLAAHFGHCEQFALFEVDCDTGAVEEIDTLSAPPHQPGLLPRWLREKGAECIIAGGMGRRAQQLFAQDGIRVIVGAPTMPPQDVAQQFAAGELETGDNICDH